jgi:hypothetical protein
LSAPPSVGGCWAVAALALVGTTSCAPALPDIPSNECGNHVVEASEDCDGFAPKEGLICRAPGTVGECHLDCRRRTDGTRPPCPEGWGCDRDAICRAPTGLFEQPLEFTGAGAWSVLAADFDGDGRADILSRDRLDTIGQAKLRFQYFDENGALEDTRFFPKSVVSPKLVDLSGDGRTDVVFSDMRLGVLLGRSDRGWIPETFSSYRVAGDIRLLSVHDGPIEQTTGFLALATLDNQPGFFIPDFANGGVLRRLGSLPESFGDLVGDPVTGELFEDPLTSPCRELVYALKGASTFSVLESCTRDPSTGVVRWLSPLAERVVALDPSGAIDGAPQLADMNGDAHLDVLVGVAGKPYVSFGDGQRLSVAVPFQLPVAEAPSGVMDIPMPLAAGDFTGDGVVDFVFPSYLYLSARGPTGALPSYSAFRTRLSPWTVAKIADLNGNGKPDVVAASDSALDIDFYNGTGGDRPTVFSLPTNGPVQKLEVGDFDGDSINDLAFIETAASTDERDALKIAFGTPLRPPLAAISVASVSDVQQLGVYTDAYLGSMVVVSRERVGNATDSALTLLSGSGDRIPFAPYELTTFASDGSLSSAFALALAPGAFTSNQRNDVIAMAGEQGVAYPLKLWLLPARDAADRRPLRFDDAIDASLFPIESTPDEVQLHLASAVADLDEDGRDEALFAMPTRDAQVCGILIVSVAAGPPPALGVRPTIALGAPCPNPDLLPVDADADGWIDIALLTGASGPTDRRIIVLWNDGHGGFTSSDVAAVDEGGPPVQAFTVLGATPVRPFSFAYVSEGAVMLASALPGSRRFGAAQMLTTSPNASGIVAADVNGDGATDLVLAASGNLSVLKAGLKSQ